MSVIYKERERERERDSSSRTGAQGYTTVRRYKIPDHSLEPDTYESEMRLVHRGGRSDFDDRRSNIEDRRSITDDRRSTNDYVHVERDDREVREYRYHDRSPSPRGRDVREYREHRIQREVDRSPSPSTVRDREIRIAREYEREVAPREDQYSLEKYSRDVEYFREPQQPQQHPHPQHIYIRNEAPAPLQPMPPIIIREEAAQPIIIREREPVYEHIERTEIQQERQVARPAPRQEEDYYYERRVKEVDRGGRHEKRYAEEREYGRDRYGDRNYYSDDDVVYVHKEKDTWGSEINTKRDVAAGALAGIAAGQIGDAPGGSVGNALGYGTLGAVSAVALDKFNNRDRSRSISSDRGRRRHHSHGRGQIGALAALAGRKNKEKPATTVVEEHRHRSRSRRSRSRKKSRSRRGSRRGRSESVTVIETTGPRSRSRSTSKHMDSKHRNNRTAQAGLASAAIAGLVTRHRSKSRKREGKHSHSRIREGVPIAAAGVTGAAVEVEVKIKVSARPPLWLHTRQQSGEIGRRPTKNAKNDCTESPPGDEDSAYSTGSYSPYDSPRPSTTHPNESRFFPETNYFPPPPTAPPVDHNTPYPPYNPADYPPPQANYEPGHPSGFVHAPPHEDLNPGNPYARPAQQQQPHDAYYGQSRRPDDNVSALAPITSGTEHLFASARDGVKEPESPSPLQSREKTVQFDLNPRGPSREPSPGKDRHKERNGNGIDDDDDGDSNNDDDEHRNRGQRRKDDERSDSTRESGRRRKRHHGEDEGDDSDATIDLPPRFDEHGRTRRNDPMADTLESVLQSIFR
ncbi:hypothetical protein GQ44DRAFT_738042 [Phaeosphaeriaceae sp. PMI808]|nr:hypothetical protein GQ44DRAFT_738042 [Phaeosphaeriaceae sp. PMI808]